MHIAIREQRETLVQRTTEQGDMHMVTANKLLGLLPVQIMSFFLLLTNDQSVVVPATQLLPPSVCTVVEFWMMYGSLQGTGSFQLHGKGRHAYKYTYRKGPGREEDGCCFRTRTMRVVVPFVCYCAFIHFLYDMMNGQRGRMWHGFVEMYLLFRHVYDLVMDRRVNGGKRMIKVDPVVIMISKLNR